MRRWPGRSTRPSRRASACRHRCPAPPRPCWRWPWRSPHRPPRQGSCRSLRTSPNAACADHCAVASASASIATEQRCPRSAYMPRRGTVSTPTRWVADTPAPSVPTAPVPKSQVKLRGATAVAPASAVTIWLGPRCGPRPVLMAAASAVQNPAPLPVMLSYTSGTRPGRVMVKRQLPALAPGAMATTMALPRLPVCSAVRTKPGGRDLERGGRIGAVASPARSGNPPPPAALRWPPACPCHACAPPPGRSSAA